MLCRPSSPGFTLIGRIAEHAAAVPKAIAVAAPGELLTYAELDSRASQLAEHLRTLGARSDVLVAILLERSIASVVSALAVLKAGAAYLPLDPGLPPDRLSFMLKDSGAAILITRDGLCGRIAAGTCQVVKVDSERERIANCSASAVETETDGNDLAYVIYTSGSTGQPKGVEITRGSLQNLVDWHLGSFAVAPADRAGLLASIGFDAAVWELWPYLAAGASVHIPSEADRSQVAALRRWLISQSITISFVATPLAEFLVQAEWPASTPLRVLLTGADTLHRRPRPGLPFTLVNNYGPTECTVVATSGVVAPSDVNSKQPSIGRAIDNAEIHIVDEELHPVAPGMPGELVIGGAGVARGYRNRPELTAERFVPNPFASGNGCTRLYRTGDRARFRPDGEIEFLGRLDDQIKIRGYRVELAEISNALNLFDGVQASAVTVTGENQEEKGLLAYMVVRPGTEITSAKLRQHLRKSLPEYMIPSAFVPMESLPVTSNGKIDRGALPKPNGIALPEDEYVAPRGLVEERLAELIAPLLRVDRVGSNDNFFLLGGHSLLGTQLLTRISDVFGVDLSLLTIFDHPTLAGISAEIEKLILTKIDPNIPQPFSQSAGDYR